MTLQNKTIVLTRALADEALWASTLRAAGAHVVCAPCINIQPISHLDTMQERTLLMLAQCDWIAFSSRYGVQYLAALLSQYHIKLPNGISLAAVGPQTALEVARYFKNPALVATPSDAHHLALALSKRIEHLQPAHIFLPIGSRSRTTLRDILQQQHVQIYELIVYETRICNASDGALHLPTHVDYIIFTSPSCVAGFVSRAVIPAAARVITLGATTSEAAKAAGLVVWAQAKSPSLQGCMASM